ncbi:MAG: DUF885 family protein [Chloroflexia bacterium]
MSPNGRPRSRRSGYRASTTTAARRERPRGVPRSLPPLPTPSAGPSDASKALISYAFTEGWAHYCEQMMVEAGYRDHDPKLQLAQLIEALLRDCRYIVSILMHTQGMSVEDATRFLMHEAYMEELFASREAQRGTFDPGYPYYTLGKLMLLKLREDYERERAWTSTA